MTTQESNKLIAEFMGYVNTTPEDRDFNIYQKDGEPLIEAMSMKYHTSWDWLMAVVEKIEELGHGVTIYRKGCHINNEVNFSTNGFNHSSKIEQTYKAVIEFIKWYNQNK